MPLSTLLVDTSSLLHDSNYLFSSQAQLTRWINRARNDVAKRTGCIRRMITGQSAFGASAQAGSAIPGAMQPGALPGSAPNATQNTTTNTFQTITGVERYPYQGFANPYLQQQHAGVKGIVDVITCSVSWGGSMRPALDWYAWEDFQAYLRSYQVLLESFPAVWSVFNDGENGEVYLFPVPDQPMEMEWDCFCVPQPLATDDDYDAIPDGFKDAVPYGAAKYAYLTKQQFAQAEVYEGLFADALGVDRVAADRGKTPTFYQQRFVG